MSVSSGPVEAAAEKTEKTLTFAVGKQRVERAGAKSVAAEKESPKPKLGVHRIALISEPEGKEGAETEVVMNSSIILIIFLYEYFKFPFLNAF